MFRIAKDQNQLIPLDPVPIADWHDVRELILRSREAFSQGIGQELFVIETEVRLSETDLVPCDLLALDQRGRAVIVVVRRGRVAKSREISSVVRIDSSQLRSGHPELQHAMTCAAMISKWKPGDFLKRLSDDQAESLGVFLNVPIEEINQEQRMILIGEAYDKAVLTTAQWLRERYVMQELTGSTCPALG